MKYFIVLFTAFLTINSQIIPKNKPEKTGNIRTYYEISRNIKEKNLTDYNYIDINETIYKVIDLVGDYNFFEKLEMIYNNSLIKYENYTLESFGFNGDNDYILGLYFCLGFSYNETINFNINNQTLIYYDLNKVYYLNYNSPKDINYCEYLIKIKDSSSNKFLEIFGYTLIGVFVFGFCIYNIKYLQRKRYY
jgi:hypothetical protein